MTAPDLSAAAWRKSTYSNGSGNCVEVASAGDARVAVRDSKDKAGPVLLFTSTEWDAFVTAARDGEFEQG